MGVAEQVTRRLGAPHDGEFGRWLSDTVGLLEPSPEGRRLGEALARLGLPLATTNYDGLLESGTGRVPFTWRDGPMVQQILRGDRDGIVHLHGYWTQPDSIVLGVRSYEAALADAFTQGMLRALTVIGSVVLVGFGAGLEDPNFTALRRWMRQSLAGSQYRHFRLVTDDEHAAAHAQHEDDGVTPLVYGAGYDDLLPFLESLAPSRAPTRPPIQTPPPRAVAVLPARREVIGREALVDRVVEAVLAAEPRPVPLLGAPGIGKSALSLACAYDPRVVSRFQERRIWVRCDGAATAEAARAEITQALGLASGDATEATTIAALSDEPTLLILDNAETPAEGDVSGTEELLSRLGAVPTLALICSFRGMARPLGPRWTEAVTVPPLSTEVARALFLATAGERFASDPMLDELLTDLDGVAIAVELLAYLAQSETTLDPLASRWQRRRTDLLKAGDRQGRRHSVAVSFDLSIENPRLTGAARRLLSLLGVLPDGIGQSDLDAVLVDGDEAAAELKRFGLAFDEGARLRVLKPVRDHLEAHYPPIAEDRDRARRLLLDLLAELAPVVGQAGGAQAAVALADDSANLEWAVRLSLEDDDPRDGIDATLLLTDVGRFTALPVVHLLDRAVQRSRRAGDVRREALAERGLGIMLGHDPQRGSEHLGTALDLFRAIGAEDGEATCLASMGSLAVRQSKYAIGEQLYDHASKLFVEQGNAIGEAGCLNGLADLAMRRSDLPRAHQLLVHARERYRAAGSVLGEANAITSLVSIALTLSDLDEARRLLERASALHADVGDRLGVANCVLSLGEVALRAGDGAQATAEFERALVIYERIRGITGQANCHAAVGHATLELGDPAHAKASFERALELFEQMGNVQGAARSLQGLGLVAFLNRRFDEARSLLSQALDAYSHSESLLGEANCRASLGDVANAAEDRVEARDCYDRALALYRRVGDPWSIGLTHKKLATVTTGAERRGHLTHARDAWAELDRPELLEALTDEEDLD